MKRSASPLPLQPSNKRLVAEIVRLNVGGRIFDTTAQTLAMSSYFEPFLQGRMDYGRDDNDRLFIDRDGKLFAYLLNFMRTAKLHLPQKIVEERRAELLGECDFFLLDWMALENVKGFSLCVFNIDN